MHKVEPARGIPQGLKCPNCGMPVFGQCVFETILLCRTCYDIATRLVTTCQKDLDKTLDVYKRILVAAIKEKRLHLQHAKAEEKTTVHGKV